MTQTPRRFSQLSITLQFLAMGIVWGASFLFMKVALTGVSFGQVAWARTVFGAITLAVIILLSRQRLPKFGIVWLHLIVLAVVNCVGPYLLYAWAEQYVSSSLASIYNAVTPIMTALMVTFAFRVEKLTRSQTFGILLGILGVLVIIGPWRYNALTGDLWGQLACLLATVCYGFTYAYTRKYLAHQPITGSTLAFLNIGLAAVIMIALTPVLAWHPMRLDIWVVGSLVLLGALGTGFAYVWNFNVLRAWGPTNTSTVTYLTPVVGVLLGVLILGERFSWNEPLGAVLVLVGILFTQQRLRLPGARPAADGGPGVKGQNREILPESEDLGAQALSERT